MRHAPTTAVTLSGTQLFGTTVAGGSANDGTIFTLNTDGSGFKLLHTFVGGASDGIQPDTALTLIGSKLYGTTEKGGVNNLGTMFSMNVDGTGFTILHSFGTGTDGRSPSGDLTIIGSKLFGATASGGTGDGVGTIFSINTDGTDYSLFYSVLRDKDGTQPRGGVVLSGGTLFETTFEGQFVNAGAVISLPIPEPSTFVLAALSGLALLSWRWRIA